MIIQRYRRALNNEYGYSTLETIIVISLVIVLSYFLLSFLAKVLQLGRARANASTTTGWDLKEPESESETP